MSPEYMANIKLMKECVINLLDSTEDINLDIYNAVQVIGESIMYLENGIALKNNKMPSTLPPPLSESRIKEIGDIVASLHDFINR